jgi:peptidoglycan/xylan/chitin deacetylase (PgdA/CDA1 family)
MNPKRSSILTYHSLDHTGSVISIAPELFREQMLWLARSGVPVAPLDRVASTPGAVAITFDDGFVNFFEHALPVLQFHGFPATVFVISGYCGRTNQWPSQPDIGIPALDLMDWDQVREASRRGVTIGAHTITHPWMSTLDQADAEQELRQAKADIEDRIGLPVESFSYPYGDSTPAVRTAASRYFQVACGTEPGFVSAAADPMNLPRIDMYYLRQQHWFRNLQAPQGTAYVTARRWARALRQNGHRFAASSRKAAY